MRKYSDSTLMRMTKAELIEQLRCAEHNREATEEQLAQQAENVKDWVPVVHCKDCKYFGPKILNGKRACRGYCLPYCIQTDFCSYGERKDSVDGR